MTIKPKKLYIELADTMDKRSYGLKNRKNLAENHGMLFKFANPSRLSFWMESTYIPLDIAFIDDQGKILQINNMIPLSTRAITSNHLCKYALEVNSGWFNKNKISVGNKLSFKLFNNHTVTAQGIDQSQQNQQAQQASPEVILEMSVMQTLQDANINGKKLIIIYQTKAGKILPPKTISPPFDFESSAEHKSNAVVKVWDEQNAGWKSFIIDNILEIQDAKEIEESKKGINN
jgi:uncharacterized membrane protein (UPF0127 family)